MLSFKYFNPYMWLAKAAIAVPDAPQNGLF